MVSWPAYKAYRMVRCVMLSLLCNIITSARELRQVNNETRMKSDNAASENWNADEKWQVRLFQG